MNISRKIYEGADIKVKINIVAEGFSMERDNFSVRVYTDKNPVGVTITKTEMYITGDHQYVFLLHSSALGTGTYFMETTAYIPDIDFGERVEIDKKQLCVVDA